MTQYTIYAPQNINAEVSLPASKSISNRALTISAMAQAKILPHNISDCDDTRVMLQAINHPTDVVDIMAAGTAMRFLTAYFCVTPGTRTLTGTERMRHRPIAVLVDALRLLGAQVEYASEEGFPPLLITGRTLSGGELSIEGSVSSQYISALLMIGPLLRDGLRLTLTGNIISRPYIDLTLRVMRAYGAKAQWNNNCTITVQPTGYRPIPYHIENDWSAASYWYQIAALSNDSQISLPGLFVDSGQGDQAVKDMFLPLGVTTTFTSKGVVIKKEATCAAKDSDTVFTLDFTAQPDLAQTLVVTCCMLGIPFRFTGLQSLRIKETDRIAALQTELHKWGYILHNEHDSILYWTGERCEDTDASIDTYDDHRMAMAFAPAALLRRSVTINNPQVVSKSYPTYWQTLQQAGFALENSDKGK